MIRFPERGEATIEKKSNSAVCLSGGGGRAAICAAAVQRALLETGAMSTVRYVTAVSGSSWAALIVHCATDLDEVLGANGSIVGSFHLRSIVPDLPLLLQVVVWILFPLFLVVDLLLKVKQRIVAYLSGYVIWIVLFLVCCQLFAWLPVVLAVVFFSAWEVVLRVWAVIPCKRLWEKSHVGDTVLWMWGLLVWQLFVRSGVSPNDKLVYRADRPYQITPVLDRPTRTITEYTPHGAAMHPERTCHAADSRQAPEVQGGGAVEKDMRVGSIATTASSCFSGVLPGTDRWADAGLLDNAGLLPALQRGVKEIVVFLFTETPLARGAAERLRSDPRKLPKNDSQQEMVDACFAGYFGIKHEMGLGMSNEDIQVFETSRFPCIIDELEDALAQGAPPFVHCKEMEVLPNAKHGIDGYRANVTFFYLSLDMESEGLRKTGFRAKLSDQEEMELRQTGFPNLKTFSPELVNFEEKRVLSLGYSPLDATKLHDYVHWATTTWFEGDEAGRGVLRNLKKQQLANEPNSFWLEYSSMERALSLGYTDATKLHGFVRWATTTWFSDKKAGRGVLRNLKKQQLANEATS